MFGVVRRVLRDPAQSEEVAQEVLVEVWRTATRFDAERGSASTWIHTMAHRRAIDRVRSAQASHDREQRVAAPRPRPGLRRGRRRRSRPGWSRSRSAAASRRLTDLQRESVTLAYYGGYTYREVAELLDVPLGTVKTRMRDGLIRLRDCLGVMRMTDHDLHTLTGAYAADALDAEERAVFERHLRVLRLLPGGGRRAAGHDGPARGRAPARRRRRRCGTGSWPRRRGPASCPRG